jgi:negative regulator of sigma-B (phosphoserine phosphatase)
MEICHGELIATRGAAVTLIAVREQDENLHWLAVGNVDARVLRAEPSPERPSEGVVLRGGLIGCRLPNLLPAKVTLQYGDVLVIATDGVNPDFDRSINVKQTARQIAQSVMRQHFKGTDDALVLAARYVGGQNE